MKRKTIYTIKLVENESGDFEIIAARKGEKLHNMWSFSDKTWKSIDEVKMAMMQCIRQFI